MPKTYVLLKELLYPDGHYGSLHIVGSELKKDKYNDLYYRFPNDDLIWYEIVENNPEWFKLKEDKIAVQVTLIGDSGKELMVFLNSKIPNGKLEAVKKAIEFVLNDRHAKYIREAEDKYGVKIITEKELLDAEMNAFNAARETLPFPEYERGISDIPQHRVKYPDKYRTFSDYKNNQNK